jgi:ketosteroid isomerase-like protein
MIGWRRGINFRRGEMMGNLEIIKDAYEALGRGDVGALLSAFDPQIEWREAESNPYQPDGSPWIGGEAVTTNLIIKLGSEWDGFTVSPIAFYDAGDTVVVETRYTGSYRSTGMPIDAQAFHVWKLRDGKATSFQEYVDTAQLRDVMGSRTARAS